MRMKLLAVMAAAALMATSTQQAEACTGITLKTADGTSIPARTIEWGGSDLNSKYVIVPRGYTQQSYIPGGQKNGLQFTAKYGYVGLAVEQEEFVAEGLNEKGLSAGLFYFPRYGQYEAYSEANRQSSIADLQLVSWILGNFSTVDEVIEGMKDVHVVAIDPRASTVHWRITEPSGRQIVIEITEGKVNVFENRLGVLTNSPGFEWQMTNLNNYVNLYPGTAQAKTLDGTGKDIRRHSPHVVWRRQRILRHTGRRNSAFTLCARSVLSGNGSEKTDCRRNRAAVFPDTQQLRHTRRH